MWENLIIGRWRTMLNLLKLVTKSVTNFWSGNFCPLIDEIVQTIRNIDMKLILSTERFVGYTGRSWWKFKMTFEASFWSNTSMFHKVGHTLMCIYFVHFCHLDFYFLATTLCFLIYIFDSSKAWLNIIKKRLRFRNIYIIHPTSYSLRLISPGIISWGF